MRHPSIVPTTRVSIVHASSASLRSPARKEKSGPIPPQGATTSPLTDTKGALPSRRKGMDGSRDAWKSHVGLSTPASWAWNALLLRRGLTDWSVMTSRARAMVGSPRLQRWESPVRVGDSIKKALQSLEEDVRRAGCFPVQNVTPYSMQLHKSSGARGGQTHRSLPEAEQGRKPVRPAMLPPVTEEESWLLSIQTQLGSDAWGSIQRLKGAWMMARGEETSCSGSRASHHIEDWPWKEEARVVMVLVSMSRYRESFRCLAWLTSLLESKDLSVVWLLDALNESICRSGEDVNAPTNLSCLPWLLFCIARRHREELQHVSLEKRRPWLEAATQCFCAANVTELLEPAVAKRRREVCRARPTSCAQPFKQWLPVLQQDAAVSCASLNGPPGELHDQWTLNSRVVSASTLAEEAWEADLDGDKYITPRMKETGASYSSCFRTYWQMVLVEILVSGWDALATLSSAREQLTETTVADADRLEAQGSSRRIREGHSVPGYYAVGVFQSLRRMICSLGKHNHLDPILTMYQMTTGAGLTEEASCTNEGRTPLAPEATRWRSLVLAGRIGGTHSVQLWREVVLLDAFTLITLGHVSEHAVDIGRIQAEGDAAGKSRLYRVLEFLQHACTEHVHILNELGDARTSIEDRGTVRDMLRHLTGQARKELVLKLQEGIRLSCKALLRLGDRDGICAMYDACPFIGGSWEVGRALVDAGHHDKALNVLEALFGSARQRFASGVPRNIRQLVLDAVHGAARDWLGKCAPTAYAMDGGVPAFEGAAHDATMMMAGRYEEFRSWGAPLPPVVFLEAMVDGILTSSYQGVEPPGVEVHEYCLLYCLTVYVVGQFLVLCAQRYATTDGLRSRTVDLLIASLVRLRRWQREGYAPPLLQFVASATVNVLVCLVSTYPLIPLARCCLMHMVQEERCAADVAVILKYLGGCLRVKLHPPARQVVFSRAYLVALLQSLPHHVLDSLCACLQQHGDDSLQREMCPSQVVSLQPTPHSEHLIAPMEEAALLEQRPRIQVVVERQSWQYIMDLVREGLARCDTNNEQRLPWRCFLCQTWNGRKANVCKLCQALDYAVVQCARCFGLATSRHTNCQVCGAGMMKSGSTTHEGAPSTPSVDPDAVQAIFPLRAWTCRQCHTRNEAHHLFYCTGCRSTAPGMERALHGTAWTCSCCGTANTLGLLRPWCPTCGTLHPTAAQSPTSKSLWQCLECRHLNPWVLQHCDSCGGAKSLEGNTLLQPLLEVPWETRSCNGCHTTNPPWSTICRRCGAQLPPQRAPDRSLEVWMSIALIRTKHTSPQGRSDDESKPEALRCAVCGTASTASEALTCLHCNAVLPQVEAELWVCLHGGCLHTNLTARSDSCTRCQECDTVRGVVAKVSRTTDPLGYSQPQGIVSKPPMPAVGALLFPTPVGARTCSHCHSFVPITHLIQICPYCENSGFDVYPVEGSISLTPARSAAEQGIAMRQILREMYQRTRTYAESLTSGSAEAAACAISVPLLQRFVKSAVHELCTVSEESLPWRCCDLEHGMLCGVEPRQVTLPDNAETTHSSVTTLRGVVAALCTIALVEGERSEKELPDVWAACGSSFRTTESRVVAGGEVSEAELAVWSIQRPWVLAAVDLVDVLSRSTDYDELGFATLTQLCYLIRPAQGSHIERETRWAYLREMKLTRSHIVNDAVCPTCLKYRCLEYPSSEDARRMATDNMCDGVHCVR